MRAARAAFVLWGLILMEPVHADAPDARPEIRELVEKIRAGRTFYGNDVDVLLAPNGRLEPATVALLAKGLAEAGSDPRQELALALVLSAQRADPLRNQGREAILDQGVVDALAGPGISKTDPAKETCLWALVQSAPPRLVALRGAELLASLKAHPDPTTALAVAKAKPAGALETIERGRDGAARESRRVGQPPRGHRALARDRVEAAHVRAVEAERVGDRLVEAGGRRL